MGGKVMGFDLKYCISLTQLGVRIEQLNQAAAWMGNAKDLVALNLAHRYDQLSVERERQAVEISELRCQELLHSLVWLTSSTKRKTGRISIIGHDCR
eukprot:759794-Hanusia_phi.AAC.2